MTNDARTPRVPDPGNQQHSMADRLMSNLDYRLSPSTQPLDPDQVAVVLRALADHTAIMQALHWNPKGRVDEASPWPQATKLGRWLHTVADDLEDPR